MQYPTWIRDIAINAIGLSGIRSECRGGRVRISPRDRLQRMYMLVLFEREKPLYHSRDSIARGTDTYVQPRVAGIFNFIHGINFSPGGYFFPLRYYEGKCRREWDLNKKAIFHVPRDYFSPIHFTSIE